MKYTCPYFDSGISFEPGWIRSCHSNVAGPIFFEVNNKNINLDVETMNSKRLSIAEQFAKGVVPECCKNCFQLFEIDDDSEINLNIEQIHTIYISHWRHCNSSCSYCVHRGHTSGKFSKKVRKSDYYDIVPILKSMLKQELIKVDPTVYITGGECVVLKEFPKIVDILYPLIKKSKLNIFSSGIQYSKSIEKLLKENKCEVLISLDCGCPDLYKKIKRTSSFKDVISNIKKYIKKAPAAKENIILKYIILKNLNDNKNDIEKFLNVAKDLGIQNVQLDLDYSEPSDSKLPEHYYELYEYFEQETINLGLLSRRTTRIMNILEKGHVI